MANSRFTHYNNNALHYAKAGNGEQHLLVFHGFGQDLSVFDFLSKSLAQHYTFYIFDLYFHGKSKWANGEQTLEKTEWKETLAQFLSENGIENFNVAGFSLGGKFALASLEAFPEKIKKIYLIAPDGIKTSFWYSLATYPILLRRLFKSMILHPDRFINLAKFLNLTGLVDTGLIRFAEYQMNSEEKRNRVYYSWIVFRHLHFNLSQIARIVNKHKVKLVLIAGKYDRVIEPKNMGRLLKKLEHYRFEIVESGHTGLINQSIPFFIEVN